MVGNSAVITRVSLVFLSSVFSVNLISGDLTLNSSLVLRVGEEEEIQQESSETSLKSTNQTIAFIVRDPGAATAKTRTKLLLELCPEVSAEDILFHRFFNDTQNCYETGERGPCAANMVFFGIGHDTIYGKCECNYNDFERILVFHPESKKCYFTFQQGYCGEDEWIVFNKDWQPACEPNTCLKHQQNVTETKKNPTELVPYKGRCVPLGETCQEIDVHPQFQNLHPMQKLLLPDLLVRTSRSEEKLEEQRLSVASASATNQPAGEVLFQQGEIQFVRGRLLPQCVANYANTWRLEDFEEDELLCLPGSVSAIAGECLPHYDL